MRLFLVMTGVSEKDGTPVYRSFERLDEAINFAKSTDAKQVIEMEVTKESTVASMENN